MLCIASAVMTIPVISLIKLKVKQKPLHFFPTFFLILTMSYVRKQKFFSMNVALKLDLTNVGKFPVIFYTGHFCLWGKVLFVSQAIIKVEKLLTAAAVSKNLSRFIPPVTTYSIVTIFHISIEVQGGIKDEFLQDSFKG